jgi:hypothetical protein
MTRATPPEEGARRTHARRNAKIPALTDTHPTNVILLTCDGFGVLPPVSKLTREQARPCHRARTHARARSPGRVARSGGR